MGLLLRLSGDKDKDKIFLERAADLIIEGDIFAYPTNTVYGLGGDPLNVEVVNRIFDIKLRNKEKGFPVLVSDLEEAKKIGEFNFIATQIAEKFWPGQVTVVVKKKLNSVPKELTGNKTTIALRVPENEVVLTILNILKDRGVFGGIIGTSANISDEENIIRGEDISNLFFGQIDLILDAGETLAQIPSTIIDCSSATRKSELKFLRIGKIKQEEILGAID